MNFIHAFLLAFFLKPAKLYKALGIDVAKLKSILTYKLIMDDRQPFGLGNWQQRQSGQPVSNATWLAIGMYTLMGLLFMAIFFFGDAALLQFTIFFGVFLVMVTLAIVVDFARVLIDVRDNFILLPKPLQDRTLLASRILHITIHISKMVVPLSLPSLIVIGFLHGIIGLLAFMFALVLAVVFALLLINVTYLAILTFSKPEKFKHAISYLQIGLTIAIMGGYQIVPRLISESFLNKLDLKGWVWSNAIPSFWFASLWQWLVQPEWNKNILIGSILAIVMPLIGLFLVIRIFAPAFNQKLSLIAGSGETKVTVTKSGSIKRGFGELIGEKITQPGPERMGFDFCWKMMLRSREFKMMVYPGIGYIIVLLAVFIVQRGEFTLEQFALNSPGNTFLKLAILYFPSLLLLSAITTFHLTPLWKASWIYELSTTPKPGKIISGATKAVMVQFMFVPSILLGFFGFAINGLFFLPVLLLALSLQVMLGYILQISYGAYLPFSQPFNGSGGDAASIAKGFMALFVIGLLGFCHWLVLDKVWLSMVLTLGALYLSWLMNKSIEQTPWKNISMVKK
jgi:hypothetical protein